VFTARYALSPYIKQIRFVFKGLNNCFRLHFYNTLSTIMQSFYVVKLRVLDTITLVTYIQTDKLRQILLNPSGITSAFIEKTSFWIIYFQ
jgi:hypothetical protein